MNYEQARQIGPDGPAPGKWNWTNLNDSVADHPYTVAPCAWPDFTWPPYDHTKSFADQPQVTPTGRERCDHDTQEEAEQHYWRYELARGAPHPIDKTKAKQLNRCAQPGCEQWADYEIVWPGIAALHDFVCERHLTVKDLAERHPFVPGMQVIHS
jgi:hypothetical protein